MYEKIADLAFNKREKHSLHTACHMRFVFACFLGKFRLSDPSASLFEISSLHVYGESDIFEPAPPVHLDPAGRSSIIDPKELRT